jgi:bacillopeptidase F (M6 metalloprotease family)
LSRGPAGGRGGSASRDATIVRSVTVPTSSAAQVSFDGYWNEETGWDFGFVQVSTDGGLTYTSLSCPPYTTSNTDPGALPTAKANVPGFTGIVNGWQHVTCSLAPYAGQTIALQFRSWNDPLTFGADETKPAGFWVSAIVTYDDPSETAVKYAPYQLTVNGVVQPGGA